MISIKLTAALAFIAVASAGSISYNKRSDGHGSDIGYGSESAWDTAGKLAHDYKFEVKHDNHNIPIKHEGESYVASGHLQGDAGLWNGDIKGDYYAYPKYKFEYGVHDPHTHDHKSQWEVRDGDVVKGEYTLDEADGTKRVVKYHADDKTGFNAKVERIGHAHHEKAYGAGY